MNDDSTNARHEPPDPHPSKAAGFSKGLPHLPRGILIPVVLVWMAIMLLAFCQKSDYDPTCVRTANSLRQPTSYC